MKAIALVVVDRGSVDVYEPNHVDVRVVDLDNIKQGDDPTPLPPGVGFETLVLAAELVEGEDYVWETANETLAH